MSAVHDLNLGKLESNAVWLMPAFTFKFDYSDPKHFDELAKLAFQAAQAIKKEAQRLFDEAEAKDRAEAAKNPPKPAPDSPATPTVKLPGGTE